MELIKEFDTAVEANKFDGLHQKDYRLSERLSSERSKYVFLRRARK